jgi:uncharacterized damage-inducible protein DinB
VSASGRPEPGEYADYAAGDIARVPGADIAATLAVQLTDTITLFQSAPDPTFAYAPGKWTVKEVVGHLSDDERIFAYRALCLARNDTRPLAGFDEKDYVRFADFGERSYGELLDELRAVRAATISLANGLNAEAWLRRGIVNGYSMTVRGLLFHIAGHELHHREIIRARYLSLDRV